jgi:hypothetical protein
MILLPFSIDSIAFEVTSNDLIAFLVTPSTDPIAFLVTSSIDNDN